MTQPKNQNTMTLEQVTPKEAMELFTQCHGHNPGSDLLEGLVQELEYAPLAISQAASYFRKKDGQFSIPEFLALCTTDKDQVLKLLQDECPVILTTLYRTFCAMDEDEGSAATDLLYFMSLIRGNSIPLQLLRKFYKRLELHRQERGQAELQTLEQTLEQLKSLCLVRQITDDTEPSFRVLRLVQLSMGRWIQSCKGRCEYIPSLCIDVLATAWLATEDKDSKECKESLLPHVHAALVCEPTSDEQEQKWIRVVQNAAELADDTKYFMFAKRLFQKTKEMQEETLLKTTVSLLRVLVISESFSEAREVAEDVKDRMERQFWEDHGYLLAFRCYLGLAYAKSGELKKAEQVLTEALDRGLELLQEDDELILDTMSQLAEMYRSQRQYHKAHSLYRRIYETLLKKGGKPEDNLLIIKAALASNLLDLGNHDKKGGKPEDNLLIIKAALASNLLDLGNHDKSMGKHDESMGKHEEAKQLLEEVHQESVQQYGEHHWYTAEAKLNLGRVHMERGNFEEAETLLQEARYVLMNDLGITSTRAVVAAMHLADLYQRTSRAAEAFELCKPLAAMIEQGRAVNLQTRHQIEVMMCVPTEMYVNSKYDEALAKMDELINICQRDFGDDDELTKRLKRDYSCILRERENKKA
ncbi:unnamed protein product [Clonostachys rosea]|uniref:MalT-like TPR region domain-containing protein n=1 Tax=Bionectria ochroleuca TaxID=29856 RepID=A0ABY6U5K9_BIOOC|nr:unnamed protein product [Clonostachys rosea]